MSKKREAYISTKNSRKINVHDKDGNFVAEYPSMSEAARQCNVKVQNIWKILNGYKSTLNGYYFSAA